MVDCGGGSVDWRGGRQQLADVSPYRHPIAQQIAKVDKKGDGDRDAAASNAGPEVAKITATRNCLWQMPTQGIGYGSRLHAGQRLELAAGLVEITFDDGATVVLEGPATFDVRDRGEARLEEGRLAAIVPEHARGFEVATTGLNVVDFGTEFGMMAERGGDHRNPRLQRPRESTAARRNRANKSALSS